MHFFFQDQFSVNLFALYMHFALQELHDMSRGDLVVKQHVLLQELRDTSYKLQDARCMFILLMFSFRSCKMQLARQSGQASTSPAN